MTNLAQNTRFYDSTLIQLRFNYSTATMRITDLGRRNLLKIGYVPFVLGLTQFFSSVTAS